MPTLADIYSAIDSAKRRGSDFVRNPGASLQQMLGYANDRARNLNEQTAAAAQEGASYGPASQALAMKMAEGYNPMGMTVYHGSPHLFQKFDLAKIGTGEGNQAYGRGLYMAQSPAVANRYKESVTNLRGTPTTIEGAGKSVPIPLWAAKEIEQNGLDSVIADWTKRAENQREQMKNSLQPWLQEANAKRFEQQLADLQEIKNAGGGKVNEAGNFYKVDLPDTHIRRMLDFDTKLKDQPIAVRRLAKSLGMDLNDLGGDLLAIVGKDEAGKQTLQNAGIRGVKYLDQQSRDATQGTRNFVVFDPNNLTILERNQQPIK